MEWRLGGRRAADAPSTPRTPLEHLRLHNPDQATKEWDIMSCFFD
jgi:hypothetical protein